MYMLVGLGNPGGKYAGTRHNIGFLFLDYLAEKHGFKLKGSKWNALVAKESLWGEQILLVKPETYMNLSGTAVGKAAAFYQIAPQAIIVVHDDLDLALGRVRIVTKRGAGGHNGVRSIIEHLGAKDFVRIRVGINRPDTGQDVARYVLSVFTPDERERMQECLLSIEDGVRLIVEQGVSAAMNRINAAK